MKSRLSVLHLEADRNDAALIRETLAAEGIACDIVRVDTRADLVSAIEQGGLDLILSAYFLPSFDGLSALGIAREKSPAVPFIFVSRSLGEDAAIRANAQLELDGVLNAVCEETTRAVKVEAAWINLYDPERDVLDVASTRGLPPEFGECYRSPSRALLEQYTPRIGPMTVIPDAKALSDMPNNEVYTSVNARTVANATCGAMGSWSVSSACSPLGTRATLRTMN